MYTLFLGIEDAFFFICMIVFYLSAYSRALDFGISACLSLRGSSSLSERADALHLEFVHNLTQIM